MYCFTDPHNPQYHRASRARFPVPYSVGLLFSSSLETASEMYGGTSAVVRTSRNISNNKHLSAQHRALPHWLQHPSWRTFFWGKLPARSHLTIQYNRRLLIRTHFRKLLQCFTHKNRSLKLGSVTALRCQATASALFHRNNAIDTFPTCPHEHIYSCMSIATYHGIFHKQFHTDLHFTEMRVTPRTIWIHLSPTPFSIMSLVRWTLFERLVIMSILPRNLSTRLSILSTVFRTSSTPLAICSTHRSQTWTSRSDWL